MQIVFFEDNLQEPNSLEKKICFLSFFFIHLFFFLILEFKVC